MTLLAIQRSGARLVARAEGLAVVHGGRTLETVPIHEVTEVHLYGAVELDPSARVLLLARGIDVLLLTRRGGFRGRLLAPDSSHGDRRRAQYAALACPEVALALAQACVAGKVENSRRLLARLRGERRGRAARAALAGLRRARKRTTEVTTLDSLRGVEGNAAALYFAALREAFVHPDLVFRGRNRRPPRDPINACLSFGYTLLLRRVESAILRAGLDPYLGALHEPGRSKPSLALDLMEELRPLLVDRLVLRLVNRRQLAAHDFEDPDLDPADATAPPVNTDTESTQGGRAVYLGPTGRAIFLRELSAEWRRSFIHPDRETRSSLEALVEERPIRLARAFLEESPKPHEPLVL